MRDKKALQVLESWLRLAYQNADGTDDDSAELYEALQTMFNLINLQKAEIERLEKENEILSKNADTAFQDGLNEAQDLYAEQIKNEIEAEARKEFAERLDEVFAASMINSTDTISIPIICDIIKETLEEMEKET